MNDRYLFRAKRLDDEIDEMSWAYGYLVFDEIIVDRDSDFGKSLGLIVSIAFEIDIDTVGQCTGLKDKNGKLIFEGDILQIDEKDKYSKDGKTPNLVVRYSEKDAGFYAYYEHGSSRSICYSDCYAEIVGNIYDNPQLMEVQNG